DYTRHNEMQFQKSLQLFTELSQEFPENPFWDLMAASVRMRLGQTKQGEVMYRHVFAETARAQTVAGLAIHQQVAEALRRLHPSA
ncbi:MAG: hypothetical protein ACRD1N_03610, partial [Terriglobia bacterium]